MIFKRVERFISYDPHTAYSVFAALCGCDSIVVPIDGITKDQWQPDQKSQYGIAYGFDDLDSARQTRMQTLIQVQKYHEESESNTQRLIKELDFFFQET